MIALAIVGCILAIFIACASIALAYALEFNM